MRMVFLCVPLLLLSNVLLLCQYHDPTDWNRHTMGLHAVPFLHFISFTACWMLCAVSFAVSAHLTFILDSRSIFRLPLSVDDVLLMLKRGILGPGKSKSWHFSSSCCVQFHSEWI